MYERMFDYVRACSAHCFGTAKQIYYKRHTKNISQRDNINITMVAATPSAVDIDTNANNDPSAAVPDDVVQAVADAALQQALATPALTLTTDDLVGADNDNDGDMDGVNDMDMATALPPPLSLPNGWILKESRSQPDHYYYFHYDSGVCSWQPPPAETDLNAGSVPATVTPAHQPDPLQPVNAHPSEASYAATVAAAAAHAVEEGSSSSINKRSAEAVSGGAAVSSSSHKRPSSSTSAADESNASGAPKQVRVLHILKKHQDSRKPTSWRQAVIQATRDQAAAELTGLVELLQQEEPGSPDQQATFEELARTESDCSSAKRGGDLGFFGRKKMQPAFEAAAFGLQVGEMSGLVDTNSGVHVLLRIG
jgi:NIMA-interacting peptidyl-prolyl cis-trans isomerase 1